MARAGWATTYVDPLGWRRPRPHDASRILKRLMPATDSSDPAGSERRLTGLSPLLIPGARLEPELALNEHLLVRALSSTIADAATPLVAWVYTPTPLALRLLRRFPPDLLVYHCTQAHRFRPHAPAVTASIEDALSVRADVVITDSLELTRERDAVARKVLRIPSGVNPACYRDASPPAWSQDLRRPVIGYLGSIDHRISIDRVRALAEQRPAWTFALVGPRSDADVRPLRRLPNVLLRPQVPKKEVPEVLAAFDVGMMPYAERRMTRYTYPAKLHQYLAAGLPVVSSPIPDLDEFSSFVSQANDVAEWLRAIEAALATDPQRAQRQAVASENSWDARWKDIKSILDDALAAA